MKRSTATNLAFLLLFTASVGSIVFAQRTRLQQWLGPARPEAIVSHATTRDPCPDKRIHSQRRRLAISGATRVDRCCLGWGSGCLQEGIRKLSETAITETDIACDGHCPRSDTHRTALTREQRSTSQEWTCATTRLKVLSTIVRMMAAKRHSATAESKRNSSRRSATG